MRYAWEMFDDNDKLPDRFVRLLTLRLRRLGLFICIRELPQSEPVYCVYPEAKMTLRNHAQTDQLRQQQASFLFFDESEIELKESELLQ